MTLQEDHGSVVAGELLFQAWPETDDACYVCGRPTHGCYVIWELSTGELTHVCDECVADGDGEDDEEAGESLEFLREGQPEWNGAFGIMEGW